MPSKSVYVLPAVFMEYKGVTIYHVYEDGELNERMEYRFSPSIDGADDSSFDDQFDVRELEGYCPDDCPDREYEKKRVIQLAIIRGEIKAPGIEKIINPHPAD